MVLGLRNGPANEEWVCPEQLQEAVQIDIVMHQEKIKGVLRQPSLYSRKTERRRHGGHALCPRSHRRSNKNPEEVQRSNDSDKGTSIGHLQSNRDQQ
ncbi:unnamed protein product [Ixodes hexagonus]